LSTLPRASSRLGRVIFDCLALPPDGTGLIALAEALSAACAALCSGEARLDDWRDAFHRLSLELQVACGVSHELDRAQLIAGHPRRHAAIALLEPLSLDLGPNARSVVEERRRRVYLHAVTWQLELSPIGLQLRQLNRSASASNHAEIRLLSEPVAVLAQRVATVATPRKWKRVFCAVMRAIAEPLPDYAQPPAPRPSRPARSRKARPFLDVKVLSTRARSIFQGSGLASFPGSLLPAYFERLSRDLPLALVLNEESQYAAAVLFVSLLGVAPRDFPLVSLDPNAHAIHLDVDRGVLRWPIRGLVKTLPRWQRDDSPIASTGDDWVEVPQAEELMQWARAQRASRPGSTSLDQLFDLSTAGWMTGFEVFVHQFSLTSRDLTIERLIHGVPRLAYAAGLDAMYVDAFFCVAGLAPRANYHYATLRASRMNGVARHIYRLLGLSGRLAYEVTCDASLGPAPSEQAARRVVQQSLASIAAASRALRPRTGIAELGAALAKASLALLSAVVFITGHRGMRVETIARSHFSFDRGVWFSADKFPGEIRPIPVPAQLVGHFEAYFAVVHSVAYRLRATHPDSAMDLVRRLLPNSTEPLFIMLDADGTVRALATADVAAWLGEFGLARNDGRRYLANILQDAGLSIADENAVAGRAGDGQQAYPESSALVPALVVDNVRAVLERTLAAWSLPQPYVLSGRTMGKVGLQCSPLPVQRLVRPRQLHEPETCPFRLHDGFRLTQYAVAKSRFESNVPDDAIVAFAHALIFESGVEHEDELIHVLEVCFADGAYVHEGLGYVQSVTPTLGLRELKIGQFATCLIGNLPAELPAPLELRRRLDKGSADLLHSEIEGALGELLDAAHAAHAYGLPGPIRDFVSGRLAPRTPSLKTRARHLNGHVGPMAAYTEPRSALPQPRRRGATSLKIELRPARLLVAKVRKKQRRSGKARSRLLKRLLMSLSTEGMSAAAVAVVDVMRRLTQIDDAPGTVIRYERPVRDLIERVPREIHASHDRLAVFDWGPIVSRALADARSEGDASVRKAAYDHFFAVLEIGIDAGKRTLRSAPSSPVDAICPSEVEAALTYIAAANVPERIRMKATALLLLRISFPNRSDEPRWLRWRDVHLGSTLLVTIAEDAGAALKSPLAARDASINADQRLRDVLRTLLEVRGKDERVFASDVDPSELNRVESLVEGALKAVAGTREINAMVLRRYAINASFGLALAPDTAALRSTEQLRSDLITAAATAGHSSCWTALRSYAYDFSEWRYAWFAEGTSGLGLSPNPVCRERIVRGCSLSAARKQVQRTRSRHGLAAPFAVAVPKHTVPLKNLAPSTERVALEKPKPSRSDVGRRLGYLFHRIAGDAQSVAEAAVSIDPDSVSEIESRLSLLAGKCGTTLRSTQPSSRPGRSCTALMIAIHAELAGSFIGTQSVEALLRAIRGPDEPWLFDHERHVRVLEPLMQSLSRASVSLEVRLAGNCSREAAFFAYRLCEALEVSAPKIRARCGFAAMRDCIEFDFLCPSAGRRLSRVLVTTAVLLSAFDFTRESS
jgi:hypothetical protein